MAVVPKAKRRNSERRKEHSRDAARSRRSREAEVFMHLAEEIPLLYDSVKLLDKTSIIRLAITYLKLRTLLAEDRAGTESSLATSGRLEQQLNQLYHRALDGFLMVVASDGDVLFVTDNVTSILGLTQIDVLGQSIYDLSHPCDHDEIREMIGVKSRPSDETGQHRDIFVRMKSTLTSKGRSVHIKSASYKVISCSGHLKTVQVSLPGGEEEESVSFVVIIGQSIGHPLNVEVPLDSRTFVSRHSLDMKFTECNERVHKLLGYRAEELSGQSAYCYHHALDTEALERTFKTLFCKGQASTGLYRFLAQRGGFVWLETHATVINNAATDKPEYVVCLNHVVSGLECEDVVFDAVQLRPRISPPEDVVNKKEGEKADDEASRFVGICPDTCKDDDLDSEQTCMQFVTEKILEQAVKDKDDTESAMIHRMACFLLDPSSEMSPCDQSLYAINKPVLESHDVKNPSDMVNCESEEGMTKNLSNSSLSSLLDKMEDGMEMRAPYIPMDDLVFSSVETPLVQSYVSESQLSCLMNSDPLLPSVGRDLSDPMASLFAMNLLESQAPSFHLPREAQKSSSTKRSYEIPDAIDLTSTPYKVPRLDGADSASRLDRSGLRQAPVNTVAALTDPVIHVPPFTTSHSGDIRKRIGLSTEQQVALLNIQNTIGAPEEEKKAVSSGQSTGGQPVVYLLLNGQLTPVTIATDQHMATGATQRAKIPAQSRDIQPVVGSVAPGGFVLDLTGPGSRAVGVSPAGDTHSAKATRVQTGTAFLGSRNEFPKSRGSHLLTSDQETTSQDGAAASGTTLPDPQRRPVNGLPGLSRDQLLRLIVQSLRKTPIVLPDRKPAEQFGGTVQERFPHAVGVTHSAGNHAVRSTHVVNGTEGPPPQGGCAAIRTQVRPDFLKVLRPENESRPSVLNGNGPRPLHLLREGVVAARHPPGAGTGPLPAGGVQRFFVVPGPGSVVVNAGGQQKPRPQVIVKSVQQQVAAALKGTGQQVAALQGTGQQVAALQGTGQQVAALKGTGQQLAALQGTGQQVAALKGTGQQLAALQGTGQQVTAPKGTGQQVAALQKTGQQVAAPKGTGQQVAAPPSTNCGDVLTRQNGNASEAGGSQPMSSPCSGSSMLDPTGSSVLKNLLMRGVDVNYGYRLQARTILDSQLNMG